MMKVFVTVYSLSRAYGGPEEGGWDYERGDPVQGVYTLCCGNGFPVAPLFNSDGVRNEHDAECPALAVENAYHAEWVEGSKHEYLDSFVTSNDTYDINGMDDAPEPYAGEVMVAGKYEVAMSLAPPEPYPSRRPHYE